MVSSLGSLPGYRVLATHGVVTELSATWGFPATSTGNAVLDDAMLNLRRTAAHMSANAIVGLRAVTFAAKGSVGGLERDPVGVLLVGDAVTGEPLDNEPEHEPV